MTTKIKDVKIDVCAFGLVRLTSVDPRLTRMLRDSLTGGRPVLFDVGGPDHLPFEVVGFDGDTYLLQSVRGKS